MNLIFPIGVIVAFLVAIGAIALIRKMQKKKREQNGTEKSKTAIDDDKPA